MFSEIRKLAVQKQKKMFIPMVVDRFNEGAYITKATLHKSQKIVGYSIFQWNDGKFGDVFNDASAVEDDGEKQSFFDFFSNDTRARYQRLVKGERHVGPWSVLDDKNATEAACFIVLRSLYVLAGYQGQGIGTQLVKQPFEEHHLDAAKIFVQAVHLTSSFYKNFGFTEKDKTVADLTIWAGKENGFGLYSAPQLRKPPGPITARADI